MQEESPLTFPKQADKKRLDQYAHYDKLYFGQHFDAYGIKAEDGFINRYAKLRYVVANFAGLMSRVMADMLFGEPVTFDVKDEDLQNFLDGLMEDNQLINQFYESELVNSRKGDDVFKIRIGQRNPLVTDSPSEIIIEQIGPDCYFPQFDNKAARGVTTQDVIVTQFKQNSEKTGKLTVYLHKEIHMPGSIQHEVYEYDPNQQKIISTMNAEDFGYDLIEETEVDKSLIFHIPNVRDGSGFWGTSDYQDLDTLFFALNNRLTKTDNILDKHSDPILAVPPGVLDEDGRVRKEALGMFEVDNEESGFNKPEYIVWNANLDAAEKEIERLVKFLFMFSEIAPATMGADENTGGAAESGRALKFKLLATIRKRNRKKMYYDQAIKDMLETAQELSMAWDVEVDGIVPKASERPTINWGSGVLPDENEQIDMSIKRIDSGLSTRADEIAKLDGKTPDEAKKKVKEIDDENGPAVVPSPDGTANPTYGIPPGQPGIPIKPPSLPITK
jgi:hypothetical protein